MSEPFDDAGARAVLRAWAGLAVGALAIAGLFALLLAASRVPGLGSALPWPAAFFDKGLVVHVIFSFVVWYLAVLAILLHRSAPAGPGGMLGAGAAMVAAVLLFVPAFLDRGEPTLNNYIPVIIDPVFYGGLILLALVITVLAMRLLIARRRDLLPADPSALAVNAAAVLFLLAMTSIAIAAWHLRGATPSHAFNEDLFWGGGHVLQFANVALMIAVWLVLARAAFGDTLCPPSVVKVAVAVLLLCGFLGPLFYLVMKPFAADQTQAFTDLQYALAPPVLIVAGGLAIGLWRRRPWPWADPAFLCLVLSAIVFAIGGVLGLFVDGADTRTPAHYHGVIAGINIAFMGLFHCTVLPLTRRPGPRPSRVRLQVWLFAIGQTIASLGLFWAGGHGAPRKTFGEAQGVEEIGAIVGLYMNGVGAVIAVVGGVMFIWTVAAALLRPETRH
jgi:cytochrome c oxidase subunit 1